MKMELSSLQVIAIETEIGGKLNKVFRTVENGERRNYRVIGINLRQRKYPVILHETVTNKSIKCNFAFLKEHAMVK